VSHKQVWGSAVIPTVLHFKEAF